MRHLLNYHGLFLLHRTSAFGCSIKNDHLNLLLFFATALVGVSHLDLVVGELTERPLVIALFRTLHLLNL